MKGKIQREAQSMIKITMVYSSSPTAHGDFFPVFRPVKSGP